MKKFTAIAAFVLTMALVLCSFLMPATTTATGANSNWTADSGSTIESESSEIWVVDTVTVKLAGTTGFVQNKQQLTEFVGSNGVDGKGYVNVVLGDGEVQDYSDMTWFWIQLVGSKDTSIDVPKTGSTAGITWYIRANAETNAAGAVAYPEGAANWQQGAMGVGNFADFAKAGFRFAFSRNADEKVMIRGLHNGADSQIANYDGKDINKSAMSLNQIVGDGTQTGADGVYLRVKTYSSDVLEMTISVAYPMPEDYDATASHWVKDANSQIVSETKEYLKVDYVDVTLSKTQGFIQHKALLTDFFGANGKDGKGFINVKAFDGDAALTEAKSYYFMQFVGKSDASAWIAPEASVNALSWYNYSQAGQNYAGLYRNKNTTPFKQYGTSSKFAAGGQQFVFTKDADGHVMPRGNGVGITNDFQSYTTTSALKSDNTLSQIVGDGSKTGADGVYFRFASNVSSVNLEAQLTIAYPCEAPVASTPTETPTATPTATPIPEGVNLVPEDLFASKDKANQWFGGAMSDDASHYTEENGDYVYYAPVKTNWPYTNKAFPDGEFTVKFNIKPTTYTKDDDTTAYGGMGILLGFKEGNATGFPWMNIRFDANYATKKMTFYVWEHTGAASINPSFGTDWYEGEFPEDMWFEVIMEFTNDGTKIYLDGYQAPALDTGRTPPANSLGHFPQADELTYMGLFPSGTGHYIKNFEVYKGVDLGLGALAPAATPTPSAPSATPGAQNKPTGDSSMMLIVMAIAICAGGAIVMSKKRGFAK